MNKLRELLIRPVFITIAAAAVLTACSTAPFQIDEPYAITKEKITLLKAEKATREDVTRMFGEPEMVTPTEKGAAYFYKGLNLNSLWVTFNADGTVNKLKWSD